MVTMRYFAWVREKIGKDSEALELPTSVSTVETLIDWLTSRGEEYAFLTEQKLVVRVAVDQQLVSLSDEIGDASEIAIFPPMTGG
ncbi:MAG: molybdopterin converting factor subunit 1 [Pseudomonadota bacterium]